MGFSEKPSEVKWMEIFHSKPSLKRCFFLEKLPSSEFAKPCPENMLQDASDVRAGFRVIRRVATRVEFVLTDGTSRNWDDNNGTNYILDAIPGRYVVEHGIRRVDDADDNACHQTVMRYKDRYIHICFRADLWEKCYACFQRNRTDWTTSPGCEMTCINRPGRPGRNFELVVEAKSLNVAFNNGSDIWDSNNGSNYLIGFPGKYVIADGCAKYISPTDKDLENDPEGTPRLDIQDEVTGSGSHSGGYNNEYSPKPVVQASK